MFLSFKVAGVNVAARVALDKILYYHPSPTSPDITFLYLQQDEILKVVEKAEEVDRQISLITGVKDINGHLVRSV